MISRITRQEARLRLYEVVGMFLAAIAVPHCLLLLLDDLQSKER